MADALAQATMTDTRWRIAKPREWSALQNWLLVWVVFANAGFALTYLFGSPPRYPEILIFGVVGLLVRNRAYLLQCCAFIAVMGYSVLSFIAGLFNLAIVSLAHSLVFFAELDVGQSLEYILGGIVLTGLMAGACIAMRRPTAFQSNAMTILAASAVLALAVFDLYMGMGMRGHYNRVANEDTPFASAISQSGAAPLSGPIDRHLVVVMVESLGVPEDNEEMNSLLFARYDADDISSRFDIERGTTTYYSSTTSGEIRELCGRWGEYFELTTKRDETCLPARLARVGVETTAYHSFKATFFDRHLWYPNIGFQKTSFREDLVEQGAARCGGVFPGACDRDVPAQIAEHLKRAEKPQFLYWLTLNSHLPVPIGGNLEVENCERVSDKLARDYPMICRQFAIWDAIDEALVAQIVQDDFPPTDILIVGDHMPPYFDRHNRTQFAADRVPWLLLKWRN